MKPKSHVEGGDPKHKDSWVRTHDKDGNTTSCTYGEEPKDKDSWVATYDNGEIISMIYADDPKYEDSWVRTFDKNGNLLWDNGLELWDILTLKLEKRVNVIFDKEEIVIAYSNNGEVTYKVISGSEDVFGVDNIPIESRYSRDRLISESSSNMVYWYKHYFLTYGYQRIKNNSLTDQNRRYVFYFNKIAFN